jgi:hypothetical protein
VACINLFGDIMNSFEEVILNSIVAHIYSTE